MTEKVARWELEARGDVQRVGYRDFVDGIATAMALVGSVRNDPDPKEQHTVHIDVQGPESKLAPFVTAITGKRGLIDAREVKKVGEKEIDPSLYSFHQEREEPLVELAETTAQGVRALNLLIGIGTETLGVTRENLSVSKETLKAVQEGNRSLGEKIDVLEGSFGGKMDVSIQSTERLHHDFTVRFDRVDAAYGTIGKTLLKIDKDLQAQTRATERQTDALLRLARQVQHNTSGREASKSRKGTRSRRK